METGLETWRRIDSGIALYGQGDFVHGALCAGDRPDQFGLFLVGLLGESSLPVTRHVPSVGIYLAKHPRISSQSGHDTDSDAETSVPLC